MTLQEIKTKGKGTLLASFSAEQSVAKNKKNFLKIKLKTDSDTIYINLFEDNAMYEGLKAIPDNAILELSVIYEGKNCGYENYSIESYTIKRKEKITKVIDLKEMKAELKKHLEKIKKEDLTLYELIISVYADEDIKPKIYDSPCSESSAYSFRSGYIAHVVRLCELTDAICSVYNNWDFNIDGNNIRLSNSVIKTASLLHDIGKILSLEINEDNTIVKNFEGQLHEDSLLGLEKILEYVRSSKLTKEQKSMFIHIVSSSKEKQSYGALETPRNPEAVVFSALEKIDSIMGQFEQMKREALGEFYQQYQKNYCLLNYSDL